MMESDNIQQEDIIDKKKEQNIFGKFYKDRDYGASLPQILADAAQKRKSAHFRVSEEIRKKEKQEKILAQFYKDIAFGASLPQILEDAAQQEDSTPVLVYVEHLPKLENLVKHIKDQKKLLQKRSSPLHDDDHETISKKMHLEKADLDSNAEIPISDDEDTHNNSSDGVEEIKRPPMRRSGKPKTMKKSEKGGVRGPAKEKLFQMAEVCGHSYWKSTTKYADWRKQPMWTEEFDLLYETLTDDQKSNINQFIDLSYDPVYYLLTMKKGYYTYDQVVKNMNRGSATLKKLLANLQTYFASYASKISIES